MVDVDSSVSSGTTDLVTATLDLTLDANAVFGFPEPGYTVNGANGLVVANQLVPEPATALLVALGLVLMAARQRAG